MALRCVPCRHCRPRALVQCWRYFRATFSTSPISTMSAFSFKICFAKLLLQRGRLFFLHMRRRCYDRKRYIMRLYRSVFWDGLCQHKRIREHYKSPDGFLWWCAASPLLASTSSKAWGIVHNLWLGSPCQTPNQKKTREILEAMLVVDIYPVTQAGGVF